MDQQTHHHHHWYNERVLSAASSQPLEDFTRYCEDAGFPCPDSSCPPPLPPPPPSVSSVPSGYCAGCHEMIRDRHYLSAVDCNWHTTCLRCAVCRQPLDSHGTCYTKDGQIYCKHDYFRYTVGEKELFFGASTDIDRSVVPGDGEKRRVHR